MPATTNGKAPKPKHHPNTLLGEIGIPLPGEEAAAGAINEANEAIPTPGQVLGKAGHAVASAVGLPGISEVEKLLIEAVLLLAGAVLFVYGVMVAVRPRQSAFSIPTPAVAPIPLPV